MSDNPQNPNNITWPEPDNEGGEGMVPRSQIRALEEKAKKVPSLEDENAALKRELAFNKAGIETESEKGKFFFRNYEGELEPEAIKAQAAALGFFEAPKPEPTPIDPADKTFDSTTTEAATGSEADVPVDEHPSVKSQQAYKQAMDSGATREEAIATAVALKAQAALQGDQRALWREPQVTVE